MKLNIAISHLLEMRWEDLSNTTIAFVIGLIITGTIVILYATPYIIRLLLTPTLRWLENLLTKPEKDGQRFSIVFKNKYVMWIIALLTMFTLILCGLAYRELEKDYDTAKKKVIEQKHTLPEKSLPDNVKPPKNKVLSLLQTDATIIVVNFTTRYGSGGAIFVKKEKEGMRIIYSGYRNPDRGPSFLIFLNEDGKIQSPEFEKPTVNIDEFLRQMRDDDNFIGDHPLKDLATRVYPNGTVHCSLEGRKGFVNTLLKDYIIPELEKSQQWGK